jgi:molybdopterin synthase catalytic subunit
MQINVHLTRTAIERPAPAPADRAASGAVVEFTGIVRDWENERRIAALEYEAYETMALSEMRRLLLELSRDHPAHAALVIHRIGVIPAGEAAIYARIEAAHRQEAFGLMTAFLDALKKDVPIWKRRALAELPPAQ